MTRHLDPYREFQDWLADGPTSWSDHSLDAVIRRVAVTPQRRRSHRPWELNPRRVLYAVAGLAAVVIIVAVAWAVLSGQLLPPNPPPVSTPAPSVRTSAPRSDGNSALLDDGRVLVVSGAWEGMGERVAPLAQVWDPITASLSTTGRLIDGRVDSTATALYDGRVLAVGGFGGPYAYGSTALASAELWDPATESFTAAGSASYPRVGHTATLLLDGRVLIVGGVGAGASVSAEIWDPASGAFTALAPLPAPARTGGHTATLLDDGSVLIVGGTEPGFIMPTARLWDPIANEFFFAGVLAQERSGHTATLLEDGRVLIVGGRPPSGGPVLTSAEVWDPATGEFSEAGTLREGRTDHSATRLADGRVFLFGGMVGSDSALASVEFWDPATASFSSATPLHEPYFHPSAVLLPDGRRVLVVGDGGEPGGAVSALAYDTGDTQAPQPSPEALPSTTLVRQWDLPGVVLAEFERAGTDIGAAVDGPDYGATRGDVRSGVAAFISAGCDLIVARIVSPLGEGRTAEGFAADPGQSSAEMWDPATELFVSAGSLVGRVFVFGGQTVEEWDPATGKFSAASSAMAPIDVLSATVMQEGRLLLFGTTGLMGFAALAYDPGGEQ